MESIQPNEEEQIQPSSTVPNFQVAVTGINDPELGKNMGSIVGALILEIGRHLDLSTLDGVTLAVDYDQALLDLDRGYKTTYKLTPTKSHVVGVAMTPAVLRDGALKSHIVLNASFIPPLVTDIDSEDGKLAVHLVAHECAHVNVTQAYDRCFPNVLLREPEKSLMNQLRWQTISGVWDEYAVTSMIGLIGADQTEAYEETFLNDLASFEERINGLIRNYRIHANVDQVLCEVYGACGNLLKFAAYHLGNLNAFDRDWRSCERTFAALEGQWFLSYMDRLNECCLSLLNDFGLWKNRERFLIISDISDELLERSGLFITEFDDSRAHVHIPYTPATDPDLTENQPLV